MLHIILLILKIIGIVLLVLLGLLVLAAAAFLFVPLKYRFRGTWLTGLDGEGRVSWLFHILSARFTIEENELKARVRLFGFPVWRFGWEEDEEKKEKKRLRRLKKKRKKAKKRKKKAKKEEKLSEENSGKELTENTEKEQETDTVFPEQEVSEDTAEDEVVIKDTTAEEASHKTGRNRKKKRGPISKIKAFFRKIANLKYTWQKICDTIKGIKGKVSYIKEWWVAEETKAAYVLCRERLLLMVKHLKPKIFRLSLVYGTGDPAVTGKILAVISMIYPFFQDNIHIEPHFDEVILNGDVKIKGRIRSSVLLWHAFKVYRDKNFKRALKTIRRSF